MEYRTLEAKTSVVDTELGQFTALISAWAADRERDTIAVTAFDQSIKLWRESGKNLPLLWEHSTEVVGHVDPASLHPTQHGLVAEGQIDRETDKGEAAWEDDQVERRRILDWIPVQVRAAAERRASSRRGRLARSLGHVQADASIDAGDELEVEGPRSVG